VQPLISEGHLFALDNREIASDTMLGSVLRVTKRVKHRKKALARNAEDRVGKNEADIAPDHWLLSLVRCSAGPRRSIKPRERVGLRVFASVRR
jgi:hypothetical protein